MARVREELGGRERAAREAGPFRPVVILAVLLIGLFGFAAALTLSGYAEDLKPTADGGAHALSPGATGFAGLVRLLEETGADTSVSRREKLRDDQRGSVRVLTLSRPVDTERLSELVDQNTLIVLPKWRTLRGTPEDKDLKRGWVKRSPFSSLHSLDAIGDGLAGDRWTERDLPLERGSGYETLDLALEATGETVELRVEDAQTVSGDWTDVQDIYDIQDAAYDEGLDPDTSGVDTDRPILGVDATLDGRPVFFSVHDAEGSLLHHVLTDPDLLNHRGLDTRSGARAALDMMDHMRGLSLDDDMPRRDVVFDLTLHGFGSGSGIIKTLTRPPFLAATLCGLAAVMLVGWMAFVRFGDPAPERAALALGKRTLIDNGARLVRMARRTMGLADDYAALQRRRIVAGLRLSGEREARVEAGLDGHARRAAARGEPDIRVALDQVRTAQDPGGLVRAARTLHDITDTLEG